MSLSYAEESLVVMKDRSILTLELLWKKTKFSIPIYKLIERNQTKKMQAALQWLSQCFKETRVCQVPVSQQRYFSLSRTILTVLLDQAWVSCKKRVTNVVQKEKSWAGERKPQILQWSRCSDTRWSQPVSPRSHQLNLSHGSSASCPHSSQKKDKQILPLDSLWIEKEFSTSEHQWAFWLGHPTKKESTTVWGRASPWGCSALDEPSLCASSIVVIVHANSISSLISSWYQSQKSGIQPVISSGIISWYIISGIAASLPCKGCWTLSLAMEVTQRAGGVGLKQQM